MAVTIRLARILAGVTVGMVVNMRVFMVMVVMMSTGLFRQRQRRMKQLLDERARAVDRQVDE